MVIQDFKSDPKQQNFVIYNGDIIKPNLIQWCCEIFQLFYIFCYNYQQKYTEGMKLKLLHLRIAI